jgi:hypothetical protein
MNDLKIIHFDVAVRQLGCLEAARPSRSPQGW